MQERHLCHHDNFKTEFIHKAYQTNCECLITCLVNTAFQSTEICKTPKQNFLNYLLKSLQFWLSAWYLEYICSILQNHDFYVVTPRKLLIVSKIKFLNTFCCFSIFQTSTAVSTAQS